MRNAAIALASILVVGLAGCPKKKKKTTPDDDDDKAKPECTADSDCGDGKVCKAGKCAACGSDGECGPGGKCQAGACERAKACAQDEDCADDEDCIDGFCQKPWAGTDTGGGACELSTVYFAFDDSSVQASERDRLDANAQCIEKSAGKSVYAYGHTDATGTDEYNIALSERRARAAADYLSRLGIDPARLDVVGKGEAEITGKGDEQDRRVEFQFH